MPLFAEKLVISAAGIPRLRSRPQTRSGLPVAHRRLLDAWCASRQRRRAARRRRPTPRPASAEDVDGRLGWSVWPMITPPRTGPTIWPSAETVVSVPNLPMRVIELSAWAMMLWPPIVADVCPMPSAVVATAMRADLLCDDESEGAAAPTPRPKANRIAGWCRSVHRPKPTASTIGGTAKHAAVTPTVAPSAPRARSRYVDTGRAKVTAT